MTKIKKQNISPFFFFLSEKMETENGNSLATYMHCFVTGPSSILAVRIAKFVPLRKPIRILLFIKDQFAHIIKDISKSRKSTLYRFLFKTCNIWVRFYWFIILSKKRFYNISSELEYHTTGGVLWWSLCFIQRHVNTALQDERPFTVCFFFF